MSDNSTLGQRLQEVMDEKGLSNYKIAKDLGINKTTVANYLTGNIRRPNGAILDRISAYLGINEGWLLTGNGSKNDSFTKEISVSDPFELEFSQNKNANDFMKLENGQYLMTMPLAEFNIQAGLLDHYQDVDYLQGLNKHSIIVDNPAKGRYLAFRVKGDSMDDNTRNAIPQDYIVATRELQRHHWTNALRIKDFPYWVIYSTQSSYPLLKQIIAHDTTTGVIKCHSLNDSPEYTDFELNLDEVQALFYVIDINRNIAKRDYY